MDKTITMKNILMLVILVFFISCNQSKNNTTDASSETKSSQKAEEVINEVALSVQPDIFQLATLPDTLNIKMINDTKDTIITGWHYRIELLKDDQWTEFSPKDIPFEDLGIMLRPADSKNFAVRLFKERVNYHSGEYRVAKYFLKTDYQNTRESHDVYAEFRVE